MAWPHLHRSDWRMGIELVGVWSMLALEVMPVVGRLVEVVTAIVFELLDIRSVLRLISVHGRRPADTELHARQSDYVVVFDCFERDAAILFHMISV